MSVLKLLFSVIVLLGFSRSMPQQTYEVIVIGLGSSGCTAASTLSHAGKKVLALEAQDRIGGRVKTVPFGDGVVELGAEWIHGTEGSPVYNEAVKNKVTLLPQDLTFEAFRSDGSLGDNQLINDLLNFALDVVEEPPERPEPLGQYISRRLTDYMRTKYPKLLEDQDFVSEFLHFMDLVIDNYEATSSWNDISTQTRYEELDGHQHMSWHRRGYKTFFELLLNTYNGGSGLPNLEIKLNTEVKNIAWPQEPAEDVVVTTADGTAYRARTVIVTVSLGVLKERATTLFSPPLPQSKASAIENISIGTMDKIILSFPEPWWPKDFTFFGFIWQKSDRIAVAKEDEWITKIFGASTPLGSSNTLTLWTSGDTAKLVETLPEDVVKRKALDLLKRFMGKKVAVPEPTGMLRSTWHTNPFTRGSYSYDNLLVPKYPTARVDLASPLLDRSGSPRVLFAGEATDNTHFSTVHGAADSGYREARRLLPQSKL